MRKFTNIYIPMLFLLLLATFAVASTYNGTQPKDIDVSTPFAGSFPQVEAGPATRETKLVLKNLYGFKNLTGSSYTTLATQTVFTVDCTTGNKTVNLIAVASVSSSSAWKAITIIKTDSTANTVTIDANGTETIDGALTKTLTAQYQGVTLYGSGTKWYSYNFSAANSLALNGFTEYTGTGASRIVLRRVNGTISGNADSATLSTTATNATKLNGYNSYTTATANGIVQRKSDGSITNISYSAPYVQVIDIKGPNTDGGGSTAGSWQPRTLNSVRNNNITGFSLISSIYLQVPAGTYTVRASAPGWNVANHVARLYNSTNSTVALVGTTEVASFGNYAMTRSLVNGRIVLTGITRLTLQHRAGTFATSGLGVHAGFANTSSIYSTIELWKEL